MSTKQKSVKVVILSDDEKDIISNHITNLLSTKDYFVKYCYLYGNTFRVNIYKETLKQDMYIPLTQIVKSFIVSNKNSNLVIEGV